MPPSHAPHVVIIDGSPVYAEVYHGRFAIEGYRVTTRTDCGIAPAHVLGLAPDLIVLDLRSGDGSRGFAFLRWLRQDPAGRAVPVVASTPASLLDVERHGEELEGLGVLFPDGPGLLDALLRAADAALGRAGAAPRLWVAGFAKRRGAPEERATA
jgi:CheY-like chemotaxis protein